MFQNIKVDIIYYKSNTDFELEFNLCGCCRMRLLTDKASDPKNLVHHLARAVSRSRVIIVSGPLFGDDGVIKIVSKSIGKNLSQVNNSYYGITGGDSIFIIEGATPLVTPEGYFGGCIIECGPQSMILLSENRTVRKAIMKTLIHPYIEEICAINLKEKAAAAYNSSQNSSESTVPFTPAGNNSDDLDSDLKNISENENNSDIPEEITESNADDTEITDNTNHTESQPAEIIDDSNVETGEISVNEEPQMHDNESESNDTKVEAETVSTAVENIPDVQVSKGMIYETGNSTSDNAEYIFEKNVSTSHNKADIISDSITSSLNDIPLINFNSGEDSNTNTNTDNQNEDENDFYNTNMKKNVNISTNLPILIISVLLLIILAILCYCIFYIPSKEGISALAYIRETFSTLLG